jgi:excinuclease ABC subunit C
MSIVIEKLSSVPSKPGVYLLKNAKDKVLYVGKAKNLRNRLRSYFQFSTTKLDARKVAMLRDINDLTYIVTANELEALVLEANLIKQHKPRFNIILRDDKNYPYIKLTMQEEWPKLEVVRKIKKDGALYYGPYVPAGSMWEILAFIRKNFLVRTCYYKLNKKRRPCIQYQMRRCIAPCAGNINREEYLKIIEEIRLFLNGKKRDLVDRLEKEMTKLSDMMEFEEAAKLRNRIKALQTAMESQKVVAPEIGDTDIIGIYRTNSDVSVEIFFIRNGIMIGSKDFFLRHIEHKSDKELIHRFIAQFYSKTVLPPSEILTPVLPSEAKTLSLWLQKQKGNTVKISVPRRGKKKELVHMASENATLAYARKRDVNLDDILNELQERLGLERVPNEIGALDISTISGSNSVGAFIFWSEGEFRKDMYRKLRIKTVQGIDDCSMLDELIESVIKNLGENLPDLIIIDGGKGQLERAKKVFEKHRASHPHLPMLISIAKEPDRAYYSTSPDPVNLEDASHSSLLLKQIRDEVHRAAIGYHKKLREKGLFRSPLEKIYGIGKKRRLELLKVFGSIEKVRNAEVESIAKLKGFNKSIAENLLQELSKKKT